MIDPVVATNVAALRACLDCGCAADLKAAKELIELILEEIESYD